MARYDNEVNIIETFQSLDIKEIGLLPEPNEKLEKMFLSIYDEKQWNNWINNSGKDCLPPDFYNPQLKLMMDVMRVDDHSFIDKKGKVINPTNARISKLQKDLVNKGFNYYNLNDKFDAIVDTGLPTEKDHNYNFYTNGFDRVIINHINKIGNYKKNHPNYKVIFFIFDESSMYSQCVYEKSEVYLNKIETGMPHFWYEDEKFFTCLKNSDIDYIIWYTPYKLFRAIVNGKINILNLPKAVVFGKDYYTYEHYKYKEELMISTEI